MEKRRLGKAGIEVSRLAFGSLTVGPLQAALPVDEGARVIAYAFDRGVNFIDTAQYYENYEYLKKALKLTTKDVHLCTKSYAYSRELAKSAVEQARRELDRDYIDVFMLHETESIHTIRGHMEALEYYLECKNTGIIGALGVSTHHVAGVRGAIQAGIFEVIHPIFNMKGLGIADGGLEDMEDALVSAHEAGLGIFTMKSLGGGNLYREPKKAFDFVLSKPYVHSVAVGMQSMEEVDANIAYFEGEESEQKQYKINKTQKALHVESWCEGCGNCVKRCHQKAITLGVDNKAQADREKCVLCGYCSGVCPVFAIKVF